MGAVHVRVEKADRRKVHARPFGSPGQLLAEIPLFIAVDVVQKEGWAVTCPAQLDNRQAREQHQFDRRPVGQHRQHHVFGEIQASLAVGCPRPEPCDQVVEPLLQIPDAPDLPPHFLARSRKPRNAIGPERLETGGAYGLDRIDEGLSPRPSSRGLFALLVFTEDLREYLARLVGNIQPHGPFPVPVEPCRTRLDAIPLSIDGIDSGSPFQFDFKKGTLRRVQPRVHTSRRIERPV